MFQGNRIWVANRTCECNSRQLFKAQQAIDVEMALVIERAQITERGGMNTGNAPSCPQSFCHAGRDNVDFVVARDCQANVRAGDIALELNSALRSTPDDCANVQLGVDTSDFVWVDVDHGDIMALLAKHFGDPPADSAAT